MTAETTADPAARIKSLIDITESLSAIFAKENGLLAESRPREIAPLQAEKARLAAAYAQSIRDIAANRAIVEGADSALLTELRSITQTFEARAARQRSLLNGARQAAEGVVKAVAEEAAAAEKSGSYSASDKDASKSAPVSVDENA